MIFGLSLDWANRTDLQKIAFVISAIVVIIALCAAIANIAIADEARKNNWFANDIKVRAMFYIMRVYAILFSLLVMISEFHMLELLRRNAKMLSFFWVRGMLQVFVGLLTVSGDFSPPGGTTAGQALSVIGWILVAVGAAHFVLAVSCFKEYSSALRKGDLSQMAPGAQIDMSQVPKNADGSSAAVAPPTATDSNPFPRATGTAGDFGASDPSNATGNYRI
jgi:hypothetical protein